MVEESSLWLTVDTDDLRHLPRFQGHPTRSNGNPTPVLSDEFRKGMEGFYRWLENGVNVTLFVIADQLESDEFRNWLTKVLENGRVLVGCHGLTHRSWSAWGEDVEGFSQAIEQSTRILEDFAGPAFRRWFRAPAGYIAPWMAPVLASHEYVIDSSVNRSLLLRRKTGQGGSWSQVQDAMIANGIIERNWLTTRLGISLPACGPALHIPFMGWLARRAWRRASRLRLADESQIVNAGRDVITVYWHILDHARESGNWEPPIDY